MIPPLLRKTAAAALAAALAAATIIVAFSSSPASTQTPLPLLSAAGCTDGTFVDTSTHPVVAGPNNDLVDDCQALVAIQNHWAAIAANNNLQANHPLRIWGTTTQKIDTWANGVTVSSSRVSSLNLNRSYFSGSIPAAIGNLTNLTYLNLENNRLTGKIPAELGNLTNLNRLHLNNNELTGSIPTELANLTNLNRLDLYYNRLTGSIPAAIGNLTNLTHLLLDNNRLTGSIPTELGKLTNLWWLELGDNDLTGSIPAELASLTNLRIIFLDNNRLTGSIPAELGNLTSLTWIFLNNNELTGSIPAAIGNLNLSHLNLSNNRLTGSIPAAIGNLTNLTTLPLNNNRLTGNIPTELSNLTNLTQLDLENNRLTGSIPTELGRLAPSQGGNLTTFLFCGNFLSGTVPAAFHSGVVIRKPNQEFDAKLEAACLNRGTPDDPDGTEEEPDSETEDEDGEGSTSSTTTTTTTTSTTTSTTSTVPDTVPGDDGGSSPLWNTLTLERAGTTLSQIRQTLSLASDQAIFAWDTLTQTWERVEDGNLRLPSNTVLMFQTGQVISQENLDELNLARGTERTTLVAGWNIVSVPEAITRTSDSTGFLLADELTDCDADTAIIAIANYSAQTREWQIWLPCNTAAQTRLTTGENPQYGSLAAIAPADIIYIYSRSAQTIAWNSDTQTYQTSTS